MAGTLDGYTRLADRIVVTSAERAALQLSPGQQAAEDYARSISSIPLDIVWQDRIAGLEGWDYAGTAQAWPGGNPYGIITLTTSLATDWGTDWQRALVTHEVGHVLSIKDSCSPIFTAAPFSGDQEMWATAYAISMGMPPEPSGVQAYGSPSAEQIAAAGGCR